MKTEVRYFGCNISSEKADLIALENIDDSLLVLESGLRKTRWFDYWDLHPTVATYLFAFYYKEIYKEWWARRIDAESAHSVAAIKHRNVFDSDSREKTGLWKARQSADRLGIPYDFYIRQAFKYADMNLWGDLPRPAQLYSQEFIDYISVAWKEEASAAPRLPDDEAYLADNFIGTNDQRRFEDWMVERIKSRRNGAETLCSYLYINKLLRMERVLADIDQRTLEEATSLT